MKLSINEKFVNCQFVKSAHIWSYSGPYFPTFRLNTDLNNSEYGQL